MAFPLSRYNQRRTSQGKKGSGQGDLFASKLIMNEKELFFNMANFKELRKECPLQVSP